MCNGMIPGLQAGSMCCSGALRTEQRAPAAYCALDTAHQAARVCIYSLNHSNSCE